MASNQLNAGAASFTPGGPPAAATVMMPDDSFNEYMDFVEDIHDAMDDDGVNEGFVEPPPPANTGIVSGLPAHLAKHANEFWFPESRDCVCCNGFKHGCRCASSNGGVCSSCSPGGGPGNPPASSLPQHVSTNQSRAPQGGGIHPTAGRGGGRGHDGNGQQICKFFRSPQGCRFGSGCRFLHS